MKANTYCYLCYILSFCIIFLYHFVLLVSTGGDKLHANSGDIPTEDTQRLANGVDLYLMEAGTLSCERQLYGFSFE